MKTLLILMFLAICHGAPFSSPCTEEEILKPITDFRKMVDELKDPDVDQAKKLEEILNSTEGAFNYSVSAEESCGEEFKAHEREITRFHKSFLKFLPFSLSFSLGEHEEAKGWFQDLKCKHMLQYFVTQFYVEAEELDAFIDVAKLLEDPKVINNVHEALIYALNHKHIEQGKLLIPLLKDFITLHKDNEEVYKNAKLNLKLLTERTVFYYPDAVIALNEIDSEMAQHTVEEIVKNAFTNSIYSKSFDVVTKLPENELKSVALKALYDKALSMNLGHGIVATKIITMAQLSSVKSTLEKENTESNLKSAVFNNATSFNFLLYVGEICQSFDDLESTSNADVKKDYEYLLLEESVGLILLDGDDVYKVKENGDRLRINVETNGKKYFFVLKNGDYPEDINLSGTILSKQVLGKGDVTSSQFCEIRDSIEYSVCFSVHEYVALSYDETVSKVQEAYKIVKDYNKKSLFEDC